MRVFVCNVATQHGETDGFSVLDHVEVVERHAGKGIIHAVVANNNMPPAPLPDSWQSSPVNIVKNGDPRLNGIRLIEADVVADENRYRHDPAKLAATILRLYDEKDVVTAKARLHAAEPAVLVGR
jgi:uncharacterized cofD-like protein